MSKIVALLNSPKVSFGDITVDHDTITPADALAGLRLTSGGKTQQNGNGTGGAYTDLGTWILPTGAAGAAYEARATLISGTLSTGTIDTWLPLSGPVEWDVVRTSSGAKSCSFTLEVRNAASGVVLDSCTVTLTATEGV